MDVGTENVIETDTTQIAISLKPAITHTALLIPTNPKQGMVEVAGRVVVAPGEIFAAGVAGVTEGDEGEGGGSIVGEEGEITGEDAEGEVDEEGRARVEDNRGLCCVLVGEGKEENEGRGEEGNDRGKKMRRKKEV